MSLFNTNIQPIYTHSLEEFNSYVDAYKAPYKVILTKKNNVSQANLRNMPCSRVWQRGNRMEFHYIDGKQHIRVLYALHYDVESDKDEKISYEALNYFKDALKVIPEDDKEEDVKLFTAPENTDSAYYNYCNDRYTGITVSHCYSLDRNNSFPASMSEVYPATKKYVDQYYKERLQKKTDYQAGLITKQEYERFKVYGSIFVGWLKKKHRSHAWKKIVDHSNKVVHALREYIESLGHSVLLVNTDAIKFIGKIDYKESTALGQFKYEWEDTKMYIKGVKSYAYLDGEKWKFKQAGKCLLDRMKPDRDSWTLQEFKLGPTEKIAKIIIEKETNHLIEVYE